jgi:hypothetical protein
LVRDPQDDQRDVVARLRLGEVEYGAGHLLGDLTGAQSGTRSKQRFDVRRLEGVRGRMGVGEAIRIQQQAVRRMDLDGGIGQVWISLGAQQHRWVESEMELPFAALHQLCAPLLGRLAALPEPQQAALGARSACLSVLLLTVSSSPSPR